MNDTEKYTSMLNKAKSFMKRWDGVDAIDSKLAMSELKEIFPELNESEDERIRKSLIDMLKNDEKCYLKEIAWLERQGEQKPIEWSEERDTIIGIIRFLQTLASRNDNQLFYSSDFDPVMLEKWVSCLKFLVSKLQWILSDEQKPTDKVELKFKVGDRIIEKDFDECGCGTIIDIKDGKYIFDNGGFIFIEEQGLWRLYKPFTDKVESKFKIGDIISNGKAIYRVDNIVKNSIGQDCYFLVDIEKEKNGDRYCKLYSSEGNAHNFGEITWLCEQVDRLFSGILAK